VFTVAVEDGLKMPEVGASGAAGGAAGGAASGAASGAGGAGLDGNTGTSGK